MTAGTDRFAAARAVADAVLYEGYVLYPYRASARKNQMRWQFGVVVPRAVAAADSSERFAVRTECLVRAGGEPRLTVRVRCLQAQERQVETVTQLDTTEGPVTGFAPTQRLDVDGLVCVPWDEAVEHQVDLTGIGLRGLDGEEETRFRLPAGEDAELLYDADGAIAGRVTRCRRAVDGLVRVSASQAGGGNEGDDDLFRVAVTVENTTAWPAVGASRDDIVRRSLVAVHSLLAVDGGAFVSLLDPPDSARDAAASCRNEGTFPVLIGGEGTSAVVLSSPIILYDQPEVAPESQGDLFDATEIDEILALRVLTLTDEEKAEARGTDVRAAQVVDRCDDMPADVWQRLHGAVRSIGPVADPEAGPAVPWWDPGRDAEVDPGSDTVLIGGVEVGKGSAVRLRPARRADAHDLFLAGLDATVAGVFRDVDGNDHVAVTVDGDPANEALAWQGRYLYFHPDEVEPITRAGGAEDER